MLILVGVTVTVSLNGGLFGQARKAAKETTREKAIEELNIITADFNADLYVNPEKYYETYKYVDEETGIEQTITFIKTENLLTEVKTRILGEEQENPNSSILKINYLEIDEYIQKLKEIEEKNSKEEYIEASLGVVEMLASEGIEDEDKGIIYYIVTIPFEYKGIYADWKIKIKLDLNAEKVEIEYIELVLETYIKMKETGATTPTVTAGGNVKEVKDGVPIPKGFYYVTGTANTGFVISDSPDDENNEDGNNGNQFVWVPVTLNSNLEIAINKEKTISTVKIQNTNGYDQTFTVNSKQFEQSYTLEKSTVYEITITYVDGEVEHKLYEPIGVYDHVNHSMPFLYAACSTNEFADMTLEERLYDIVREYKEGSVEGFEKINNLIDLIHYFETALTEGTYSDDISAEIASVQKYGGFYIGRYEVSINNEIKKGKTVRSGISFESAEEIAKNMYNNSELYGAKSDLPSGAAWDGVGRWMINSGFVDDDGDVWSYDGYNELYDELFSTGSKGNFKGDYEVDNRHEQAPSGYRDLYKVYDIMGNVKEWSKEKLLYSDGHIENCARGGSHNIGYGSISSNSQYDIDDDVFDVGFRPILYIYTD